jgi:hypothetical protein
MRRAVVSSEICPQRTSLFMQAVRELLRRTGQGSRQDITIKLNKLTLLRGGFFSENQYIYGHIVDESAALALKDFSLRPVNSHLALLINVGRELNKGQVAHVKVVYKCVGYRRRIDAISTCQLYLFYIREQVSLISFAGKLQRFKRVNVIGSVSNGM